MSEPDYNFNTEYCDFNVGNFLTLSVTIKTAICSKNTIPLDLADSETILVTIKISFEHTSTYSRHHLYHIRAIKSSTKFDIYLMGLELLISIMCNVG